ncbi:hypothetical protein QJS10_CPA10g00302 [Acorus calamus]|uniref:Uncharacterized protein n=1 Tax=Acorus calamus TaxID=4465 RepID=A0AAV9DXJ3_ACOCL|nr:hypothetical protein QJS10_CPA10g00302 [Acorus calamus]
MAAAAANTTINITISSSSEDPQIQITITNTNTSAISEVVLLRLGVPGQRGFAGDMAAAKITRGYFMKPYRSGP